MKYACSLTSTTSDAIPPPRVLKLLLVMDACRLLADASRWFVWPREGSNLYFNNAVLIQLRILPTLSLFEPVSYLVWFVHSPRLEALVTLL
jgi:hypothetical protein